jgi:hypothetical protein
MLIMMYTKVHKSSFYGQGLTRKDNCFHGILKNWTAVITIIIKTLHMATLFTIKTKENVFEKK